MREIFKQAKPADPGRVFYTITREDVGRLVIPTEIGAINLTDVIGRVQAIDVGKRLYRVPNNARDHWLWQCENSEQLDRRLGK